MEISGIVRSGLGEGKYFVSREGYKKQIVEKLGFVPYPGTLNLETNINEKERFLKEGKKIILKGFKSGGKTFDAADAYRIMIGNLRGAIIMPKKSRHEKTIIEAISSHWLRDEFSLKDGDKVTVKN